MRSPIALAVFAAIALASPAAAQSDAADALDAVEQVEVETLAAGMEDAAAAILAMPIGPLAETLRRLDPEAALDVPAGASLGDLAAADPALPRRLGAEARVAGTLAGEAARDIAAAMPMIEAVASDLAAQWRQRLADARARSR